jgi:hypothetical protein
MSQQRVVKYLVCQVHWNWGLWSDFLQCLAISWRPWRITWMSVPTQACDLATQNQLEWMSLWLLRLQWPVNYLAHGDYWNWGLLSDFRRPSANCIDTCPYSNLQPENTKLTWMNIVMSTVTANGGQWSGSLRLLELGAPEWLPCSAMWQLSATRFDKDLYSSMSVNNEKQTWMALIWLLKFMKVAQQSVLSSCWRKGVKSDFLASSHRVGGCLRVALMKLPPQACN